MNDEVLKVLNSSGLALILTGIGWFIRRVYTDYKENRKQKKKENYLIGLRSIAKVYNAMESLQETDEITRVLLLEISNGGNCPMPGSRMYASAINVKHDDQLAGRELLSKYEKVQIDDHYINMCVSIKEAGEPYKIDVNNENTSDSLLKSFYTAEGITYSEIYHVYTDGEEEKMFIISISTMNEGELFRRDGIRAIIRTEVNVIRSAFEKYRNS